MKFYLALSLLLIQSSQLLAMDHADFKLKPIPFKAPSIKTVQGDNIQVSYIESETGYWRTNTDVFFTATKIKNADPKTFQFFDNTVFGMDKRRVFARETALAGADVSSFIPLGMSYAKDKSQVYYWHNTLPKADPNSFKLIDARDAYSSDKSHVFSGYVILKDIDPKSFQVISGNLVKDSGGIYYISGPSNAKKTKPIKNADPQSLVLIKFSYFKDKNNIYFLSHEGELTPVPGADIESFEVFKSGWDWAKDKSHVYQDGKMKPGLNPNGFSPPE